MPLVLGGLILAFLVMLLFGGTEIDRGLLMMAARIDAPWLRDTSDLLVSAARPLILAAIAGAGAGYLLVKRDWPRALLLIGATVAGFLLVTLLQDLTAPLRPALDERLFPTQQRGFPDAHPANTTIALIALAFLVTSRRPARGIALSLAALLALTVGGARLLLGQAWPSDVIGGWAFGLAWTLFLLRLAGEDLGDGTARLARHSPPKETKMENPRTESARETDDSELIDKMEDGPGFSLTSGGILQRDIGSRAEMQHGEVGEDGVTRVRDKDKPDGDANLPRFNEK